MLVRVPRRGSLESRAPLRTPPPAGWLRWEGLPAKDRDLSAGRTPACQGHGSHTSSGSTGSSSFEA